MQSPPQVTKPDRMSSRVMPWLVSGVVGVALGLGAGWLIFAPTSANAEVAALIDDYLEAWDAGDGEAVVSFMTEDGVHFSGGASEGKAANDDGALGLAAFVERLDWATFERVSDPVVSEGPPYEAAIIVQLTNTGQDSFEAVEAFSIVEGDDGALRIAVDSSEIAGLG
ncbi:MAG: nuclear transport factor 2 family protein [Jiangellales bacterium]